MLSSFPSKLMPLNRQKDSHEYAPSAMKIWILLISAWITISFA